MPLYPYMSTGISVGWAAMCALGFIHANLAGCMSIPHGQKRKRNELSVNTTTRPPCPCHAQHRKVAGLVSLDGSSPCPHDLATRAMCRAKCSCSFSLLALLSLPVPPLFAVSTRGPFYSPHLALSNPLPPSRRIGFSSSSSIYSHPWKKREEKNRTDALWSRLSDGSDYFYWLLDAAKDRAKQPHPAQRRIKLENNPRWCRSWCAPRRHVGIGALDPWTPLKVRRMSIRHGRRRGATTTTCPNTAIVTGINELLTCFNFDFPNERAMQVVKKGKPLRTGHALPSIHSDSSPRLTRPNSFSGCYFPSKPLPRWRCPHLIASSCSRRTALPPRHSSFVQ